MKVIENKILIAEYISRINRVFDYIELNIERSFTLEELASIANFSKYHFHRVFYAMVGESPFQFIARLRLEKSASLLIINPKETISEIALKCGFSEISVFSRNFKSYYNVSPTQWRESKSKNSNFSQTDRNKNQSHDMPSLYFCNESKTIKWRSNMKLNQSVEVKHLPKMTVAYIRHTGPYKGDDNLFEQLFTQLFSWAGPRGLIQGNDVKSIIVYHDDPSVTDEQKLRMSVCITVPEETKVEGEIGKMEINAGRYAVGRFTLTSQDFEQAWQWLYGTWFPSSGYQPDDGCCFEMYAEKPEYGKFVIDICVPAKPM